jgi:hypothetical protein
MRRFGSWVVYGLNRPDALARRLLKYLARRGFDILFVASWFYDWSILCLKPRLQAAAVRSRRPGALRPLW